MKWQQWPRTSSGSILPQAIWYLPIVSWTRVGDETRHFHSDFRRDVVCSCCAFLAGYVEWVPWSCSQNHWVLLRYSQTTCTVWVLQSVAQGFALCDGLAPRSSGSTSFGSICRGIPGYAPRMARGFHNFQDCNAECGLLYCNCTVLKYTIMQHNIT